MAFQIYFLKICFVTQHFSGFEKVSDHYRSIFKGFPFKIAMTQFQRSISLKAFLPKFSTEEACQQELVRILANVNTDSGST